MPTAVAAIAAATAPSANGSAGVGGTWLCSDVGSPACADSNTARHASTEGAVADMAGDAQPRQRRLCRRQRDRSGSGCGATAAGYWYRYVAVMEAAPAALTATTVATG